MCSKINLKIVLIFSPYTSINCFVYPRYSKRVDTGNRRLIRIGKP